MARKLRGFERVLDAPSLFAVAYGEIASSLYIALGIVAGAALGLTPLVLLVTGAVFVVVSLSYAEGTAALAETGGAATFVRRAFNDLAGFITGWVLFLDFLIVMALSALFVPHYFAGAAFVLVSLSYAEGTTALPETGGAATFVRRAFNDLAGFVTGWVLFLDFLIVMALSAMFAPHYLAGAIGEPAQGPVRPCRDQHGAVGDRRRFHLRG